MKFGINFTGDSWAWAGLARGPQGGQAGGSDGTGKDKGKDKGNDKGKGGKTTGSTVGGMGTDSAGYGMNRKDLKQSNFGNPDVAKNARSLKDKLDKQGVNQTNQTPAERAAFAKNLGNMQEAYNDSLDDGVFGGLGLLGFEERNPYEDPDFGFGQVDPESGKPQIDANWDVDPIGALAQFAGLATGMPIGMGWNVAKWGLNQVGVQTPTVNLGSSVFGSAKSPQSQTPGGAPSNATVGRDDPATVGSDKPGKGGNGLLSGQATAQQSQTDAPVTPTTPTTPSPGTPTTPITQAPSKFPTPMQRFQGASYWAGDWVYNPATQKAEWKQKAGNGLLPQGVAA